MSFRKWTLLFILTYGGLEAVFVALVALALNISIRRLLTPYVALLLSVMLLAPCIHWALQFRNQPKSCAIRFALIIFFYLQLFSLILALNVVKLEIVSKAIIVDDSAPVALIGSIITAVGVYVTVRRRLEGSNNRSATAG